MPQAHDHAILRPGGDLELVRQRGGAHRQRVIAGGVERRGQALERAGAGVVDRPRLAVHRRHAHDRRAVGDADRLVPKADPQHRDRWTQPLHELDADARLLRPGRSGRDDDGVGPLRVDLVDRDLVVARDGDIGADAGEQLHEVVGERVVVVEQEDLHASPPMAASMEAALAATSAASRSGTESATIPAPACTVAMPSRMSALRMVMAHSTSDGEK